ncbi:hypothetical protein Tco_0875487 [Tanacetum coccineum]|uniref:Uncharacterized protein n=1 Tax=Tanacetum coccineum TaxID=301880 RepID=A0ABQ5BPY3_9ASTR
MRCLLQGRILILNSDEEENKLDKADTQAEIIHSQGRTIQQRKGRSVYEYDAFMLLKQTIHDYFVRFHKLVNDIKITQLNIPTHQMNTKSISSQKPTEPHGQKDAQETGAVYKIANLLMVSKKAVSHPPTTALTSSISGLMLRCRNGHIVTEPVQRKAPEEKTVARQCKRTQEKEWNLMYFKDKALLMKLKRKEIRDEGAHACSMLSSPTCQPLGATNKAVNEVHTYDNQIFDNVIIQIQRCTQAESFRPDAETEILMTIRFRIIRKEKSIAFLQSEKEKILSEKKKLADSYLDEIVCLKTANKVARDMLQRFNMPTQTIPMLYRILKKGGKATNDFTRTS